MSQRDGAALRSEYAFEFDPFRSPDREDPHPRLHRARRERPVFYSHQLGTWVVTRREDVLAILRDPGRFSSANAITNVPAPAVTQVTVSCETGSRQYLCFVFHDAIPPAGIRWKVNGVHVPPLEDRDSHGRRSCSANQWYSIVVDVTDSTGTRSGDSVFLRNSGPWP